MKPKFIMLVGLSGSGKSRYASYLGYEIISSDEIRASIYGDINDQSHNAEVFNIVHQRVLACLKEGRNCVMDATNLSAKRRRNFLKNISHIDCEKKCIVIATPIEDCIRNDKLRDRSVGEAVIRKQLCRFNMPHKSEGWDDIAISQNPIICHNYVLDDILEQNKDMAHDCPPHHLESISEHMIMCYRLAQQVHEPLYIQRALKYHDLGKFYVKDFHDAKGNPSENAHYYNHQNVSAYLFASQGRILDENDMLTLYLIQYHMDVFLRKDQWDKYIERFDDKFVADLIKVSEYDKRCRVKGD